MKRLFPYLMLMWLLFWGGFFMVVNPVLRAQSQEVVNANQQSELTGLAQDVARLHSLNIDRRLSLLEDTTFEVKWFGRTAAVALVGQFFLMIQNRRKPE